MRIGDWSSDVCSSDLARCLVASRNAFHTGGIQFSRIELDPHRDEPFDRRSGQLAEPPNDRRFHLVLVQGHVIFEHCIDCVAVHAGSPLDARSEEHTSELPSLMRISYAVFCLKKKTCTNNT